MSSAKFLIRFNGQLSINDDLVPTYVGGQFCPISVPAGTNLVELRNHIVRCLNLLVGLQSVNIICRYPLDDAYVAVHVSDDDTCTNVINEARTRSIVLYVEVFEVHIQPINQSPDPNIASASHRPPNETQESGGLVTPESSDEGYQTMDSQSSSDDEDYTVNDSTFEDEDVAQKSHEAIRVDAHESACDVDLMVASNEYVRDCQNTQEWDELIAYDGHADHITTTQEGHIPDELREGMIFPTKADLQCAVAGWSIINHVEYCMVYSDKIRFTVKCVQSDNEHRPCAWMLAASSRQRLAYAWKVGRIVGRHTCTNPILSTGHRQCTSGFISLFILPSVRKNLDMKPKEIISRMEAKFNLKVSYSKAWNARGKAIKVVFGSWEESYRSLFRFMEAVCSAMQGTVYRIQVDSANRFKRIFWAFGPSIAGWAYCRPVLSMDGTFLLGKYRGTLLTAIAMDANNGLFPLAFAIVEAECNESWAWFLQNLCDLIPTVPSRADLCIISDRHAGLVRGCRELMPQVAHRHCLRHLRENFKKAVRRMGISDTDTLCNKMYYAGSSDDDRTFRQCMTDIRNTKEDAFLWLMERDPEKWSLLHDNGSRYGTMTTNASECFNGVLKRARGLPIQGLITSIYYNIVSLFMRRSDAVDSMLQDNTLRFAPKVNTTIQRSEEEARRVPTPTCINRTEFEVYDISSESYKITLSVDNIATCSCRRPQIFHIPCCHVIAALRHVRVSHEPYVSPYFSLQHFKMTYAGEFHVIPNKIDWCDYNDYAGIIELLPPNSRRRAGRPRTRRYRNTMDEPKSDRKCGLCQAPGHNRATCPRNPKNIR